MLSLAVNKPQGSPLLTSGLPSLAERGVGGAGRAATGRRAGRGGLSVARAGGMVQAGPSPEKLAPAPGPSGGKLLQEVEDSGLPLDDEVGLGEQLRRSLLGAHRHPQPFVTLARELGYRGEGGQVAEIVADDHHVAGAGLGDDPADRVPAFVAVHRRPQLPDQLPRDDLEGVLPGDFPGGLIDRAGPLAGVGEPAGVDGDRVLLILQPGAAVAHGRGVSQRLALAARTAGPGIGDEYPKCRQVSTYCHQPC